ncbi:glycosyltransferase family 9 protein [Chitinophaga agrisoli]|uniref:Glycosyltransferase family 9 protein n=1 Tax=Chitinophaga agrisoli TaxID=2607653 RepID=A0A5B2VJJ3_9BACT|nr:glycosyltransferase family 9 protein [Chitinophaga agrisoli]KAA2239251.1 glycosyltransferase family 9 protein [Chitinophaga agrisoli]
MSQIKKIAILRALQLGDLICLIPAVRALKKAYPRATITLIGLPGQKGFATRFRHYFDHFVEFPGWPGLPEQKPVLSRVTRFLTDAQLQQYDLVLQLQGNGTHTNELCELLGGKRTAGLRLEGAYCPDEQLFPVMTESEHEILRLLKVVHALGVPLQGTALEFPVTTSEYAAADKIMQRLHLTAGQYVCLHPGARDCRRRWSPANFAAIGDTLAAAGYQILVTGSKEEQSLTKAVADQMRYRAIDLVASIGHTGIGELAVLIRGAAALLSNDTGVSHVAAALQTPSVVVFSHFSDPDRWAPLDASLHLTIPAAQSHDLGVVLAAMEKVLQRPLAANKTAAHVVQEQPIV